jgi:uncharacterized membrane protein YfcA
MTAPIPDGLRLAAIALLAATINGALGYGFSSITVPVALLFLTSRVLNPALVLVEVAINVYVLAANWRSARPAFRRTWTILLGLIPGIASGSAVLARVHPDHVRLITYLVLLPLILLQAAGLRRPVRSERAIGPPFGVGVGLLYSVTTISGPPLAVLLNNQGLAKQEFRAALALVRTAESSITAAAYLLLGLYKPGSLALLPFIVPAVLIGVPLGAGLINRIDTEMFRRLCMSFDAWIVGFGLSRVLPRVRLAPDAEAYLVFAGVIVLDLMLLYRFFARRGARASPIYRL